MQIKMPVDDETIKKLHVYDMVEIYGPIFTGRDAVLPKVVKCIEEGTVSYTHLDVYKRQV